MKSEKRVAPLVNYLENFSSGITDGLTISFALAAGLWHGGFETNAIAVACFIVSFAVGLVMAVGSFFSRRDQLLETPEHTMKEWIRTKSMMENLGLTVDQVAQAEKAWLKERSEHRQEDSYAVPISRVFIIAVSFFLGGTLPAWCFYFSENNNEALRISVAVSGICFITFGYIRDKANGLKPWWGAIRALLFGAVAMLISIGLARLFI